MFWRLSLLHFFLFQFRYHGAPVSHVSVFDPPRRPIIQFMLIRLVSMSYNVMVFFLKGSPRHSTPFGGRGQGAQGGVEKFYNASMLQDPWASLQPVPVTSTTSSQQQTTHTGRPGRYFNQDFPPSKTHADEASTLSVFHICPVLYFVSDYYQKPLKYGKVAYNTDYNTAVFEDVRGFTSNCQWTHCPLSEALFQHTLITPLLFKSDRETSQFQGNGSILKPNTGNPLYSTLFCEFILSICRLV